MKTISIEPKWNFHNSAPLSMRPLSAGYSDGIPAYFFTRRQADKIMRHFCGITDCRCGGGQLRQEDEAGTRWSILASNCAAS